MFLLNARITAMREVARGMAVISMEAPEIAAIVRAGQFGPAFFSGALSPSTEPTVSELRSCSKRWEEEPRSFSRWVLAM